MYVVKKQFLNWSCLKVIRLFSNALVTRRKDPFCSWKTHYEEFICFITCFICFVLLQSTTDMFVTEEAAKEVEVSRSFSWLIYDVLLIPSLSRSCTAYTAPQRNNKCSKKGEKVMALSIFPGVVCGLGLPFYSFTFFQEFFANRSVPAAERTIQQSLENIRLNCAWLGRESDRISTWLKEKGY